MIEEESLEGPGGTLFIVGKTDVLLTTLDGGEATVPLDDLAVLFRHLVAANVAISGEELTPSLPFRLINGGT